MLEELPRFVSQLSVAIAVAIIRLSKHLHNRMKKTFFFLAGLTALTVLGMSQSPVQSAPPKVEEALRARVGLLYTLFQQGKFRQAEELVAEDSKDTFYMTNKARHHGFEIKSVSFSPDVKEATVLVTVQMIMPMMGSKPLPFPVASKWRQVEGEWRLYYPQYKPGDTVPTAFGPKKVPDDSERLGILPNMEERPDLASLRRMYKVSAKELRFPSSAPGRITQEITVTNRSKGRLSLERRTKDIKGVEIKIAPEETGPGEKIKVSFTYIPAAAQLRRNQKVRFAISPISQHFSVDLIFEKSQVSYEDTAAKVYAKQVTVTEQGRWSLDVTGLTAGQLYRIEMEAQALPGGQGKALLGVHDGSRRNGASDGPRRIDAGSTELFAVEFTATPAQTARIHLAYVGGPGSVRWSGLKITDRTRVHPEFPQSGFEGPFVIPWNVWANVDAELTSKTARSGKQSLAVSGPGGAVYQDVSGISPGQLYQVTAWVKAEPGTEGKVSLELHDGRKQSAGSTDAVQVSGSEFEPFTLDYTATESGVVRVHLVYKGGDGTVYFDDVTVTEKSVANGGFENDEPAPWETDGDAGIALSDEVASSGTRSLALSNSEGAVTQQLSGLRPGGLYQVTAWARSAPDAKGQALLKAGEEEARDGPRKVSNSAFQPFSADFKADAEGGARIQLGYTGGQGTLYWDDVTVTAK